MFSSVSFFVLSIFGFCFWNIIKQVYDVASAVHPYCVQYCLLLVAVVPLVDRMRSLSYNMFECVFHIVFCLFALPGFCLQLMSLDVVASVVVQDLAIFVCIECISKS